MKRGKKYKIGEKLIGKEKFYSVEEAISLVKKIGKAKFDETVEIALKLGINPKQSDQIVRGQVLLPHGTGKEKVIAVIAKEDKQKEAKSSGVDIVGNEDLIEKIKKGKIDFDVLIATPDCMKDLSKLGKILGPKGLMPNPKSGTVTFEIADAIKKVKSGQIEFKADSTGIIHLGIGKISFDEKKLEENAKALIESILKARPPKVKGQYLKSITISSTMGPGIKITLPS